MIINKSKTVAFTGYRSSKMQIASNVPLPVIKQRIFTEICRLIEEHGKDTFLTGMSEGFDMAAATAVIKARVKYPHIKLIAAIPFPGQAEKYSARDCEKYTGILSQTDHRIVFGESFHLGHYFKRNDFLIDSSDCVVCFYDGQNGGTKYTFERAEKVGSLIINVCHNYRQPVSLRLFNPEPLP